MSTRVEETIEVAVPVRTAYDQWTQFEEFPQFMVGVQRVEQRGPQMTHWVAQVGGVKREWDAAILEQVPDTKVSWAATEGATNAGAVFFTALADDRTVVHLTLEYEPEGLVEKAGDALGLVERRAKADLEKFKEFIEGRGSQTGGWRGSVGEGAGVGVGAPGVEAAEGSRGDSGAAGVTRGAAVAGAAVLAGAAVAGVAAARSHQDDEDEGDEVVRVDQRAAEAALAGSPLQEPSDLSPVPEDDLVAEPRRTTDPGGTAL